MAYSHLAQDGYYYWQWSHHLALSYYDGPPLIAYTLKLITTLFGHSEFSLYSLNILTIIITSFVVYKIAKTFFGEKVAQVSVMVWLLTPGVIRYAFFETTYDPLLTVFWALAIFSFLQLINKKMLNIIT